MEKLIYLLFIVLTILVTYTITINTLKIETIQSTDTGATIRINTEEYYIEL